MQDQPKNQEEPLEGTSEESACLKRKNEILSDNLSPEVHSESTDVLIKKQKLLEEPKQSEENDDTVQVLEEESTSVSQLTQSRSRPAQLYRQQPQYPAGGFRKNE